jgi:hypothetical protein
LRRNRAGLKRMGLLALALVLALGALGVAYAAWTDSVYINSAVETGTLDADILGVSSTFAYKNDTTDEIELKYVLGETPPGMGEDGWSLIAWAKTVINSPGSAEEDIDSATMTFSGVFPDYDFVTDVEVEYLGSVPGKISLAQITPVDENDPYYNETEAQIIEDLWNLGTYGGTHGGSTYGPHEYGIWIDAWFSGGDPWPENSVDPLGLQLDFGDRVHISMHVLLPAEQAYKDLNLNFSGLITITQWNEVQ